MVQIRTQPCSGTSAARARARLRTLVKWGDLMVQVVNWGDLMVEDLHGENCIRKIWVLVPFVNIFMEYYSPLQLLYICFNISQCAATAFVNIFKVLQCHAGSQPTGRLVKS